MDQIVQTKLWHVDKNVENLESCTQVVDAARLIQRNELVAFPTETVYGLGANAFSDEAAQKIYQAKGRPSDNPLIVHIASEEQLQEVAREVSEQAVQLIRRFWPGPLTLLLPKHERIAYTVSRLDSVGVRMPDHPLALALIRQSGLPIAAPSANRSGRPSPTTAEHVQQDLEGRIAGILDGGETGVGVESTVLDMTVEPPMILRPGGVTREQLLEVLPAVAIDPAFTEASEAPRAPGMKYTHYAPNGEMWLVAGERERVLAKQAEMLEAAKAAGLSTGILTTEENRVYWEESSLTDAVISCGSYHDLQAIAQHLYAALRTFDDLGIQYIVAEAFPRTGIGMAVMNRLEKAAGGRILSV